MADEEEVKWEDLVKEPYTRLPNGMIDCIVVHPTLGELPFTADPNDPMEHGRIIFAHLDAIVPKET